MKLQDFQDLINEELLNRGYDSIGINDFWFNDNKTENGDGETIIDFIFKKFVFSENQENHSQLSEVNRNLQEKKDYNHLSGRRDNESGAVVESPASISPADTNLSESSEVENDN